MLKVRCYEVKGIKIDNSYFGGYDVSLMRNAIIGHYETLEEANEALENNKEEVKKLFNNYHLYNSVHSKYIEDDNYNIEYKEIEVY